MPTITLQVSASTDDARNLTPNGTFNSNNTTYRLGNDAGVDQFCGWRWLNVTVPQGATINSATLDFFSAQTGQGTTANVIFYGEKSANPVTFSNTTANKPEGRTRTTASVAKSFSVSNFNTSSSFGNDPVTVTSLVQEIVNQAGFASGNALVIVGHDNGSAASNNIGITNYEASGNLKGAKLTIDYSTGGSPQSITGTGYANTNNFGGGTVSPHNTITGTGLSSSNAFGTGTIAPGPVTITGSGYVNTPQFGSGSLHSLYSVAGAGFANSNAFGGGSLSDLVTIIGTGLHNTNNFGAGSISPGPVTISGTGYANTNSFGAGTIAQGGATQALTGTGYTNSNAFGTGSLHTALTLVGNGFQNVNHFGSGSLAASIGITGTGYGNSQAFGAGSINTGITVQGVGLANQNHFGHGSITGGVAQARKIIMLLDGTLAYRLTDFLYLPL